MTAQEGQQVKQVDVIALHKASVEAVPRLRAIVERFNKTQDADAYHLDVLMLTESFAVLGGLQETMSLLYLIPATFFREKLPALMGADENVARVARRTAELLNEHGIVSQRFDTKLPIQRTPGVA